MKSAVIQLEIQVVLNHDVDDKVLKGLHTELAGGVSRALDFLGQDTWNKKHANKQLIRQVNETISSTVREYSDYFKGKIPPQLYGSEGKEILDAAYQWSEILSATKNDTASMQVAFYFLTNELTLIDAVANRLLLTKGDQSESILGGKVIDDCFFFDLDDKVRIKIYKAVLFGFSTVFSPLALCFT